MNISPFVIAKKITQALRRKDEYEARQESLKSDPIMGKSPGGKASATINGETYRIDDIRIEGVDEDKLHEIRLAVNNAFDRFDEYWRDFNN